MNDESKQEKVEAIRAVIISGGFTDFEDVVGAVQKRHGLRVGSGLVEEVYRKMRKELEAEDSQSAVSQKKSPADDKSLHKALRFAEEMGGFDRARAALDEAEQRIKKLF